MFSIYTENVETKKTPNLPRYVSLHRLDIFFKDYFRLGLYEQVIFGARSIPMEYLNPITPYWSAQHSLGDLDNLLLGSIKLSQTFYFSSKDFICIYLISSTFLEAISLLSNLI